MIALIGRLRIACIWHVLHDKFYTLSLYTFGYTYIVHSNRSVCLHIYCEPPYFMAAISY